MRIVSWVYLALGLIACAVPWLNANGYMGEPDPLSGIFPFLVALPWSLLIDYMPWTDESGQLALGFCVAAVLVNFGLLRWIAAHLK
ncbi:SCO4225 family membrane protein [Croceicoccus naphthovorans]|uniref:Uncharacterized protein n=1 Tax=Croceicoccus naphthovorans TaxID=1348774 RepID=A0A0G3XDC1_9SPHN|nr:hypothetical protein [Croceicoccus naphthovorans]AKM09182.1 hypothetical protein AB433_03075 [Croceicoccus naphthovorans]MBB3990445.1 hypothetical protein [Croceicoccus naphthovorans]